jgi:cyclopropane fatty-acyl-phospholipid synthase-like methyltransferase
MKRDFDSAARTWDTNDARTRASLAIADAMIAQLQFSGTETILDYGTGTGTIALRLQPFVRQVIAADSSRGMLEVLSEKLKTSGIANVRALPLDLEHDAPASVDVRPDVIVSAMALHHIADTARFCAALHQLLSLGGRIGIADLDTEAGDFHHDNTGVEHFGFDRDALTRIFSAAGFRSIRLETADEIKRPTAAGIDKTYPVFLLTATKE